MSMTREKAAKWIMDLRDRYSKQAEKYEAQGALIPMDALYPYIQALDLALTALRPVSREQVEKVWRGCRSCKSCRSCAYSIYDLKDVPCKMCDPNAEGIVTEYKPSNFCPVCGKPLTDEAVEMVMRRLEAIE